MSEDNNTPTESPAGNENEKDTRGKKGKKKKDSPIEERAYTGTKDPADRAFAEWINRQWARGEHLDKIDVVEFFPKGAMKGYGNSVAYELFPVAHDVDMEEAVDFANILHGRAQLNCDRLHRDRKEMLYYARAFDKGRNSAAECIDTFPLVLKPRTIYFDGHGPEMEEEEKTERQYALDYMREVIKAKQTEDTREDHNIGQIVSLLVARDEAMHRRQMELYGVIHKFGMDWVALMKENADAAPQRALLQVKTEMIRDGFRVGKNLLTSAMGALFAKDMSTIADDTKDIPTPVTGTNGAGGGPPIVEKTMTRERMLLNEFLRDCEGAGLTIPLFGEWEKGPDGHARCAKPGIFTPDQWVCLVNVLKGHAKAAALDDLLMDSGKPIAVTMEQFSKAQAVEGMTEGIGSSLVQLMTIRKQKRDEARATQAAASETNKSSDESGETDESPSATPNEEE